MRTQNLNKIFHSLPELSPLPISCARFCQYQCLQKLSEKYSTAFKNRQFTTGHGEKTEPWQSLLLKKDIWHLL